MENGKIIFGLDIGTRSIVGLVGEVTDNKLAIIGHRTVFHKTRAMIDGQIHDIEKVAEAVSEVKEGLEKDLGIKLEKAAIAAAGRVLKTSKIKVSKELDPQKVVDDEMINALELEGIEQAYKEVNHHFKQDKTLFHCVGYSVVQYFLNDYVITSLLGHKGQKMGVEILATFLPQEVVDSLYTVVKKCGMSVSNLTLEPIAAINVAIPEKFRLLNLALVDIGAGTSDIAITSKGSIIAYGMIPFAGDEITETLVHQLLIDFKTAEDIKLKLGKKKQAIKYKNVLGINESKSASELEGIIQPVIKRLAIDISNKIKELNGDKSPNAVFCVGGGSQSLFLTEILSEELNLNPDRVALRGPEVLDQITFTDRKLKRPEMVTPVGICLADLNQKGSDFISVKINGEALKIFNTNQLTLLDVVAYKNYDHNRLLAKRGKELSFEVDGQVVTIKGTLGVPASIYLNNALVGLTEKVHDGDLIVIEEAKQGISAKKTLSEYFAIEKKTFLLNNIEHPFPIRFIVNGEDEAYSYQIKNGDKICVQDNIPLNELIEIFEIQKGEHYKVNDLPVDLNYFVKVLDKVQIYSEKIIEEPAQAVYNDKDTHSSEFISNDKSINVYFNGKTIPLSGKMNYVFVDVFAFADFDLKQAKGTINCKINGRMADYTQPIFDGDNIEVYWT